MDYRAAKSGFAREVQQRISEKYNAEDAGKALRWFRMLPVPSGMPDVLKEAAEKIPADISTAQPDELHEFLKDGLALGYLIGCLKPDEVQTRLCTKCWTVASSPIFETNRQRERIGAFLKFCEEAGVGSASVFQTDQLFEKTNLPQVVICLTQLGIESQAKEGYPGPQGYWLQKHQSNKRTFTEEQLKGGDTVIGLQMGYAGGANQSGVSFGARRHVMDMH
ncbi:hypothetical protein AAHC03_016918 [Spirometra sp. Aus1]|nr:unnamed protein product [Spirometra erinaceieuropaei]